MKRVITYGTFDLLHYGHRKSSEKSKGIRRLPGLLFQLMTLTGTRSRKNATSAMNSEKCFWNP